MRMYDMIDKKKNGMELSTEEIKEMIRAYVEEEIPDYQMAAWLMAVYFQGMSNRELKDLTLAMAHSGEMIDLSPISGIKVDKHSTGGVGDKTTLAIAPIVAACGEKVAKMSGKGLGFTGGTIDKLESIPGFETGLDQQTFFENVNHIGLSVIGQTANITPADKKLYALRDVTATVDSIPLIAASVMSKKLAAGSDKILLDVTCGSGAFMKTLEDAVKLAEIMVAIGEQAGRETVALITNMDVPLGETIGNALEVEEIIDLLQGNAKEDLKEVCLALASNMLYLAKYESDKNITLEDCKKMAEEKIQDGSALNKLKAMVNSQHGQVDAIENTDKLPQAAYYYEMVSDSSGYVTGMNAEQCGIASMILGAGREKKDSEIIYGAGIRLLKKTGAPLEVGDTMAILYSDSYETFQEAEKVLRIAYQIGGEAPQKEKLISARVSKTGVEYY